LGYDCECDAGYEYIQKPNLRNVCKAVMCGVAPTIDYASTPAHGEKLAFPREVQYTCDTGYTLSGKSDGGLNFNVKCTESKAFETIQVCKPIECGANKAIDNAKPIQATLVFPQTMKYECEGGYTVTGDASGAKQFSAHCQATGAIVYPNTCEPVRCGTPNDVLFAIYDNAVLKFSEKAVYTCLEGYTITGETSGATVFESKCQSNGKFSKTKTCMAVSCGVPALVAKALMPASAVRFPAQFQVFCETGFTVDGQPTGESSFVVKCNKDGQYTGVASCKRVTCGTPADTDAAVVPIKTELFFTNDATWECKKGFSTNGKPSGPASFVKRCQADGTVGKSSPADCVDIDYCHGNPCGPNGVCADSGVGSVDPGYGCTCNDGYVLTDGRHGPVCSQDSCHGDPCGSGGVCVDLHKQEPPGPEGKYSCICSDGYDLVGTYDAQDYTCVRDTCGAAPITANLMMSSDGTPLIDVEGFGGEAPALDAFTSMPILRAFDEITYTCAEGFSTDGGTGPESEDFTLSCTANGMFSRALAANGECQPVKCDSFMLPVISNAAVTSAVNSFFKFGDQVQFQCAIGYTKDGELTGAKTFEVACLKTGRFENDHPSCSPISCGVAPVKDNSQRSSILPIGFGEQVSYICNDGYLAGGIPGETTFAARCNGTGSITFESQNPTCQPISCGAPPSVQGAALFWLGDMQNGILPSELKYGDAALRSRCEAAGTYLDGSPDNGVEEQIICRSGGSFSQFKNCAAATWPVSGTVDDAQNSALKVAGATVSIKQGGQVVSVATSCRSGVFTGKANEGEVEIEVVKDGYITASKKITVTGPIALGQGADMSMSQVLGDGEWRIVLTWAKYPSDLDSHTWFGKNKKQHVSYDATHEESCHTGGLSVTLDRDNTNGYGPETTTFNNVGKCTKKGYCLLYFDVENYQEVVVDGTMGESQGVITAYKGDRVEATVRIPESAGDLKIFPVFTLDSTKGKVKLYVGRQILPPFISDEDGTADTQGWTGSSRSWATQWGRQVDNHSVIYGLYRGSAMGLSTMGQVKYYNVQTKGFTHDLDCKEVDWASSLKGWSECPAGYFLSGLIRTGTQPDTVSQITHARCCKAVELPSEWGACYEQPSFKAKNTFSECSLDSSGEARAVVGIHRSDATDITGIDMFKCCTFKDVGLISQPMR